MRRTISIRRIVLITSAMVLVLSAVLLTLYSLIVSSYFRDEPGFLSGIFHTPPPPVRNAHMLSRALRVVNSALLEDQERLINPQFLRMLAKMIDPMGVVLRKNDAIAFSSIDQRRIPPLPGFDPFPASSMMDIRPGPESKIAFQLDLSRADNNQYSLFFVNPLLDNDSSPFPFDRQLALWAVIAILAAGLAGGIYSILRITGPLKRVEQAALAMSSGDLTTPIGKGPQISELTRVFDAMETMRQKILQLVSRTKIQESQRRELIANLSHDLRTPLSAIRGYIDGLREGIADTPEKQRHYLDILKSKIQDLDTMIGHIFLLSTLEADHSSLELRRIDIRAFLSDSLDELRMRHKSEVALFSEEGLSGPPVMINGDPMQLRRVMENLVDNSIKHGGKAPIRIAFGFRVNISVAGEKRAQVEVSDDGRGIGEEYADKVFDRFYRGDVSRSKTGVGLGLAIAREIIEAHQGTIGVRKGSGASLLIELPVVEVLA